MDSLNEWMIMTEAISHEEMEKKGDHLLALLSKNFTNLYVVPDFSMFIRKDEPLLHSILFSDDEKHVFSINYNTAGEIYSVDFWKKNTVGKSDVTLYVQDTDVKDILHVLPIIAKNPSVDLDLDDILKKQLLLVKENQFFSLNEMKLTASKDEKRYDKTSKKIEQRDFNSPEAIFEDLKTYVNLVIKGVENSLIVTGNSGLGKSKLVVKELETARLKRERDYIYVSGTSTPGGVYITLHDNSDKIIVFNDCDRAIEDKESLSILNSALDSNEPRTVSWKTGRPLKDAKNKSYKQDFDFTGKIIFISNLSQKILNKALKDRGYLLEITLSREDMLDHMENKLHDIEPNISYTTKLKAFHLIISISEKYKFLEMSMRTLTTAIGIVNRVDDTETVKHLIKQQCSYK